MKIKTQYKQTKICELVEQTVGGTWGPESDETNGVPVLRSTNFTKDQKIVFENIAYRDVTEAKLTNRVLNNGDILIEISGGGPSQPVGRALEFINPDGKTYTYGNFVRRLKLNSDLLTQEYLSLALKALYIFGETEPIQTNTTNLRNLNFNDYINLEIPVPTIQEQKQIISKIKECFTLLDKSKEKLKQAEEKLNNVLDSSLLSLQRTNGDVYPLKNIVTIQKQTIKLDINSSSFYIALEDIEANTGKLLNTKYVTGGEVKSTKLRFNTKHVLYSKLRPYLNKVIIPPEEGICVTDLLPLLPNEKVTQKYLYYYLRSPQIRDYINQKMAGIKMPRLRTEDLNNMPIFVPSIETQNNFVTRIERLTEEAYQCRISIEKQAKKQELLRQLLLKKAFEGKLI